MFTLVQHDQIVRHVSSLSSATLLWDWAISQSKLERLSPRRSYQGVMLMMQAAAPIMHLRNMNAHVVSALGEWSKAQGTLAHLPLEATPAHNCTSTITFAGQDTYTRYVHVPWFEITTNYCLILTVFFILRYKLLWHEWCQCACNFPKRARTPCSPRKSPHICTAALLGHSHTLQTAGKVQS